MLFQETPEPVPPPRRKRNDIRSLLFFGTAVAGFFGALSFVSGNQTVAAPAPAQAEVFEPIRLHVSREGNDLRLSWDPEHPAVMAARRASLSITDGGQSEEVELLLTEFRKGQLVYSPAGTDVGFRLEILSARGTRVASDCVRVLGGSPRAVRAPAESLTPESQNAAPERTAAPASPSTPSEEVEGASEGAQEASNSVQNVTK